MCYILCFILCYTVCYILCYMVCYTGVTWFNCYIVCFVVSLSQCDNKANIITLLLCNLYVTFVQQIVLVLLHHCYMGTLLVHHMLHHQYTHITPQYYTNCTLLHYTRSISELHPIYTSSLRVFAKWFKIWNLYGHMDIFVYQ